MRAGGSGSMHMAMYDVGSKPVAREDSMVAVQ